MPSEESTDDNYFPSPEKCFPIKKKGEKNGNTNVDIAFQCRGMKRYDGNLWMDIQTPR